MSDNTMTPDEEYDFAALARRHLHRHRNALRVAESSPPHHGCGRRYGCVSSGPTAIGSWGTRKLRWDGEGRGDRSGGRAASHQAHWLAFWNSRLAPTGPP
jgi:hypothetical protein